MPLFHQISSNTSHLGIWRMDESQEELIQQLQLSPDDLVTLNNFRSEYRKREWLTTRVLLKELLPGTVRIVYNTNGKPALSDSDRCISISHTKNFVSVLIATGSYAGIDLETIQPRIEKIAKKFVTKEEELFIELEKKITYQHVIWGTKEVLFKIYSTGELNFLQHLHVNKFKLESKGELKGVIEKNNFRKEYTIFYEQIDSLMLVYAAGE